MTPREIYDIIFKDYPWLISESLPLPSDAPLTYFHQLGFNTDNHFKYLFFNIYNINILNELKDKFVNFTNLINSSNGNVLFRCVFQPYESSILIGLMNVDNKKRINLACDFVTKDSKHFFDFYQKYKNFEFKTDENLGFSIQNNSII